MPATQFVPTIKVPELNVQHRGLNSFEPKVITDYLVAIFLFRAVIAQQAHAARELCVAGDDCSAFAVGAEVLSRIETETPDVAESAHATAFVFSAVGLGGVFDNQQIPAPGH